MHSRDKTRFAKLYDQHLRALQLKGLAPKTIDAYARAVRRLAEFLDRCPVDVSKADIDRYFAALLHSHSWATIKVDRNGIRFFFEEVLGKALPWIDFARAPKTQRLPDILTHNEIARIIRVTRRFDLRCFWFVTYSLGLRLGETLRLEVGDIDAERRHVHVRNAKGLKDRFVILPALTLKTLRRLWLEHRHPRLLFPGRAGAQAARCLDRGGVQRGFRRAVADAGIHKRVSVHSLRHSYATHMIEAGLTLSDIQHQLGHSCPKTTARYVRRTEKSTADAHAKIEALVVALTAALRATPENTVAGEESRP